MGADWAPRSGGKSRQGLAGQRRRTQRARRTGRALKAGSRYMDYSGLPRAPGQRL